MANRCLTSVRHTCASRRARRAEDAAFERGLLLLACGLYGHVIRLLPPLTISDEELGDGLRLLDEALAEIA